jgi:SAM-dependent methyltransferase
MTDLGKKRIFSDQAMAMALGAVGAYHVLLTNFTSTMKNELVYGKDFIRDGRLVAKSSVLTGKANYSWVAQKISDLKVDTVVDLGCGSGDIIIDFCKKQNSFRGIGLDIDPQAIQVAKENVKKNQLDDRIELITGDMLDPSTYSHKIESKGEKVAFNAIMALHEFLIHGEIAVVNVLKKMKKEFPGSYFILGEFNRCTDEEFSKIPLYERMHMLFYQEIIHGLTDQDLASLGTWKKMFNEADVELVEYKSDFPFRLVEYVLKF